MIFPRWVAEITEEGRKKIRPKNALSALSIIASTKLGAFGLFLLVFVWFQMMAGLILMLKNYAGSKLAIFLGFVAVFGLIVEIVGAKLSLSFGFTNYLGCVAAISLAFVTHSMYKTRIIEQDAANSA